METLVQYETSEVRAHTVIKDLRLLASCLEISGAEETHIIYNKYSLSSSRSEARAAVASEGLMSLLAFHQKAVPHNRTYTSSE